MRSLRVTVAGLALASSALLACAPAATTQPAYEWRADHHMHIASADLCARLEDCRKLNTPVALYAKDAVAALDGAKVAKGVVLSCAYLYSFDSLKLSPDSIAYWTRVENEFTAAEVGKYPDRLVGFLSVDPLQPSALAELEHWRGSKVLRGLKMHLFASRVNIAKAEHRAKLKAVMAAAAEQGLPMVIHVGSDVFDSTQAELFLREVLPTAGKSIVQLAHGAGGGLPANGARHVAVLQAIADHVAKKDPATERLIFDLSFVPLKEETGVTLEQMRGAIREIGVSRFMFGSDFDVAMPDSSIISLRRLGFDSTEWKSIARACAPWAC